MLIPGNINLDKRPVVMNPDGTYSTVRSISVGYKGAQYLIPTVVNGQVVSNQAAIDYFKKTGQHLGAFRTYQDADRYAQSLHEAQAREYHAMAEAKRRMGQR
jgi:hypothetical protein